jgi:DNA repair exonuclease SbcCD ATPase subunit
MQKKLHELDQTRAALEDAHQTLRESSRRREAEALERIASLEAALSASRETAAKLEPALTRIRDLETALSSERGRVSAMEQTVQIANQRAEDFATRLDEAQKLMSETTSAIAKKEAEWRAHLAKLENADEEISKMTEAHTSYRQQAETRITNLQRQLAAAEAKAALVQKEFMSAVGVLPGPKPGNPPSGPLDGDARRIADLEARLQQVEAEARKKAREDGYKIAELEYRLSEAQEALAQKTPPTASAPPQPEAKTNASEPTVPPPPTAKVPEASAEAKAESSAESTAPPGDTTQPQATAKLCQQLTEPTSAVPACPDDAGAKTLPEPAATPSLPASGSSLTGA